MLINDASITGSLIVNASASFQNINVAGNIIPDTTNIHNLGSTDKYFKEIYVSTGSINFVDNGSVVAVLSAGTINAIQATTESVVNRLNTIENTTSSFETKGSGLVSGSSQLTSSYDSRYTQTNLFNTFTSSATARLSSIETITSSNVARLNSLEIKTGSLATTGSNTFIGTQTITGSLFISSNLIVQGTSSLQNITASAVDIGTNRIILNVDNPSVRYAGISVYDSGSTGGTGSLWWDSVENHWLYEHPSDSAAPYNSAILISGPKNAGNLGEELELVNNYIVKAVGGDHISSSAIYDDGTTISLKSNTEISGTFKHNASTASFAGVVGIGITNPSYTLDVNGTGRFSGTITSLATSGAGVIIAEGTATNGEGLVSVRGKNSSGTSRRADFKYDNADVVRIATASPINMQFETNDVARVIIDLNGKTSIGYTTNPSTYMLDVNGTGRFNGTSASPLLYLTNTTGGTSADFTITENTGLILNSYEGASARSIDLRVGGNSALFIASTGAATFASTVTGTSFFNSSDIRLKELTPYEYNVSTIKPISYFWKDGRDNKKHLGYNAQEIQKVMPEAVNEDINGFLTVNYVEVLVAKIEMLEKEIKSLKNK